MKMPSRTMGKLWRLNIRYREWEYLPWLIFWNLGILAVISLFVPSLSIVVIPWLVLGWSIPIWVLLPIGFECWNKRTKPAHWFWSATFLSCFMWWMTPPTKFPFHSVEVSIPQTPYIPEIDYEAPADCDITCLG